MRRKAYPVYLLFKFCFSILFSMATVLSLVYHLEVVGLNALQLVLVGTVLGETTLTYFPSILWHPATGGSFCVYIAYGGLCLLPMIFDIREEIQWARLQSKI